jgi:hypothetical protein
MTEYEGDALVGELIEEARQAFAHGILSSRAMLDYGIEGGDPMEPLPTNIESELVHLGWYLPKVEQNYDLHKATRNMLARQLIVAVGDAVKRHGTLGWDDSEYPIVLFLRHVRNAAAHDNKIGYEGDDDPAPEWNGCVLTVDDDGRRVFTEVGAMVYDERADVEGGFLKAGDALSLANDIQDLFVGSANDDL